MKTSYVTRFSYAATDVAGQLVFCWVTWYAAYFYSDVCKIPAATVGTILLLARWLDALDAPIWGLIFDKTTQPVGQIPSLVSVAFRTICHIRGVNVFNARA